METVRISAQMVRQMSLICYNTTQCIILHLRQTQVNTDKMKVVHFQKGPKIRACTIFDFKLGKKHTEIVNTYRPRIRTQNVRLHLQSTGTTLCLEPSTGCTNIFVH